MAQGAPKGNRFWELRSSHGRKPKFKNAEELLSACCEYFEWVEENPLLEERVFCNKDGIHRTDVKKKRPMTIKSLLLFIDIDFTTWQKYGKRSKDFNKVTSRVEEIIYEQKFAGAASGFFNANIIARDLGLVDKSENKSTMEVKIDGDDAKL